MPFAVSRSSTASPVCAMNLFLHGVGPTSADEGDPPVRTDDSLRADPGERFDVVLTNPPFGKKSSMLVVNEEGDSERQALTVVRDDSGRQQATSSSTSSS